MPSDDIVVASFQRRRGRGAGLARSSPSCGFSATLDLRSTNSSGTVNSHGDPAARPLEVRIDGDTFERLTAEARTAAAGGDLHEAAATLDRAVTG
jgi:hypothetical protein